MKKFLFATCAIFISMSIYGADEKKSTKDYLADLEPANTEAIIVKAADWLGKEEEKDAMKKLVPLLKDSREKVRLHAVMALGYIGEKDSAKSLNDVLLNDSSSSVRYAAILSTYRIGLEKASLEAWKQASEKDDDPFIKDFLKKMEDKWKKK